MGSGDDGWIDVVGGRPHNLQGVRVRVPKGVIVVFTGVSGSGKTSLLMNTIRAEAQLRYLEGITPFVRQFVTPRDRPKVDRIDGLPPTLAVDQRHPGRSAQSSLATIKAVGDYLRLVYARLPPLAADWDGSLGAVLEPAQLDPGSPDGWCPSCHDSGGWARAEADPRAHPAGLVAAGRCVALVHRRPCTRASGPAVAGQPLRHRPGHPVARAAGGVPPRGGQRSETSSRCAASWPMPSRLRCAPGRHAFPARCLGHLLRMRGGHRYQPEVLAVTWRGWPSTRSWG